MSEARKITQRQTDRLAFGVKAGERIARGAMVGLDANGLAVEASAAPDLTVVGVAAGSVDNHDRPNGELAVTAEREAAYRMDNDPDDPLTAADLFKAVYASSPFSVAKTDGGGVRSAAGQLVAIEDEWAWVRIG